MRLSTGSRRNIIRKSAMVYSNDPKHPNITLTMAAQVNRPISVEPQGVMMEGFLGEEIVKVVTIKAHEDQYLTLEPVKLSLPKKVAYELKPIEQGRVYQVVLRNISQKKDKYSGFMTLKTNYPQKPEITIRFLGYIRGVLQFRPETINFGQIKNTPKSGQRDNFSYQRSVRVTLNRGHNLKIEKIDINHNIFETHVTETQAGKIYRIDVKLHPDKLPKGIMDHKMKVYTNVKDDPVRLIPIRGHNM